LPAYAQGRPGCIHAHHGAHVFADGAAAGDEHAEHIYSVVFEAADLWPEAAERRGAPRDRVFLDLWESYLERP
jgi:nitrile hydratase